MVPTRTTDRELKSVVRRELDDVERALKAGDNEKALDELENAVRKLKRISNHCR
jgi:hypothetical protein